jgi:hypothetical protein
MKKNIIIGVQAILLIFFALSSYVQKLQAEETQKKTVECEIRAQEQMVLVEEAKEAAEMARLEAEHAAMLAQKAVEEAKKQFSYKKESKN